MIVMHEIFARFHRSGSVQICARVFWAPAPNLRQA
jgi:hypothetical protein